MADKNSNESRLHCPLFIMDFLVVCIEVGIVMFSMDFLKLMEMNVPAWVEYVGYHPGNSGGQSATIQ